MIYRALHVIVELMKNKLFFLIFLGILFFPLVSLAGSYQADGATVTYEGLVPCGVGKTVYVNGTPRVDIPCQFCHFFIMIDGILDFIITTIVPIIAVLMIVIGGIMFFAAAGNPASLASAKKLLTSVIIGLVIIYGAWILVNTFFLVIGVAETDFGTGIKNWFQINCPIEID